jgi:predicted N-acetyltransferase YhbS
MMYLSQIEIRKMLEKDLPIVSNLSMIANPFTTREKYVEHLIEELTEFPDLSFVATINGKVVGYVRARVYQPYTNLEQRLGSPIRFCH